MKLRILALAFSLISTAAFAADLPPVYTKAPVYTPSCQSAGNCSGAYWDFALENNANLGGALTGSSTSQVGLDLGLGYQLWKGSWLAGIEGNIGYQPGTGGNTGTLVSTQFVKLGYNFFTSATTSTTASAAAPSASQNPFIGLVPANIIANSTPAVIAGGCLSHAIYKGCAGLEIDSVIAAGWTTAFQYYNAPSVAGQADENVFRIMVQKHF